MSNSHYPRDLIGYGAEPPKANWPGQARIAVQFVLNYEEGGENCVLHGDSHSEVFLSDIIGAQAFADRHMSMESLYEYGSRAGAWRILREFRQRGLPLTVFGVSMAMQRHPDMVRAFIEDGHEIACHGLRWIHYQDMSEAREREHMQQAIELHTALTGQPPLGWYTGRDSPNTRRLVVEAGGFEYDSDYYGDDLPFWTTVDAGAGPQPHLIVPYALDTNDMKFWLSPGYSPQQWLDYAIETFEQLYREGTDQPGIMNLGLHLRIIGRPGRIGALERFMQHVASRRDVWVTSRLAIARHFAKLNPVSG